MSPNRIQRKHHSTGWRMPENSRYVGMPGPWGNAFSGAGTSPEMALELFVDMLNRAPREPDGRSQRDVIREKLRGKDLVCWCPLDQPCHADVLLEIANGGDV